VSEPHCCHFSQGGLFVGLAGVGAGLYFAKEYGYLDFLDGGVSLLGANTKPDYAAVRKAIADELESNPEYDDGNYGPLLVRLAWHTSGTFDKNTGRGGSNGATMRFAPENAWGANAGLGLARDLLEPIKKRFPWISYSDLWTLAGAVAIEELGGPVIPWRPGRSDVEPAAVAGLPDGLLPDGDKGPNHIRDIFYRMGFNDQEIVALLGSHSLGRCHPDRSGWDGPWTNAPTTFSNLYFSELLNNKWHKKKCESFKKSCLWVVFGGAILFIEGPAISLLRVLVLIKVSFYPLFCREGPASV
jgi:cytochrome c peroxidase